MSTDFISNNTKDQVLIEIDNKNSNELLDNLRLSLINDIIKIRQDHGISQKQLENICGVKQPIIARMEKGTTSPQLDTILKILLPLGKTLAVVPIDEKLN